MKKLLKCTNTVVPALLLMLLTSFLQSCELGVTSRVKEPYKIGAVLSLTGGASFLGNPEKNTLLMQTEIINQQGGVDGHPLELVIMDSQSDPEKASAAVEKLILEENVLAIIGPSTSGSSIEALPLSIKYETPMISCASSHKIAQHMYIKRPYSWVFKVAQSDSMAVEAIYAFMRSKGIKNIAVVSIKSGFGLSGMKELSQYASEYGINILGKEKYSKSEKNFKSMLKRLSALNPQAIINWSIGPSQVEVVKAWKELGLQHIHLFQSHGFGSVKNIHSAGGAAEGVYLPLGAVNIAEILPHDHPQKEVTMRYSKNYKKRFNEPVNSFGGHAWDALNILVQAMEKAGADKNRIREEIENTNNFVGQGGVFNMSINDHNGLDRTAFNMIMVRNNTWALAE